MNTECTEPEVAHIVRDAKPALVLQSVAEIAALAVAGPSSGPTATS
jgi:hypothetical protein